MITFHVECWSGYSRDCQALWREHYEEIASDKSRMPMRVHEARFESLDATGQLLIVTARKAGRMIGYCLVVKCPHPHYADVPCGFEDAYFLSANERHGKGLGFWSQTGVRLITFALDRLKEAGVKKVFWHTKECRNIAVVLKKIGMKKCDEVLTMWIGD